MHAVGDFDEEDAVFNIGTVARKSGVSVTTIRTWEDRYGAVVPVRDESGRRLYSNLQIAQLTWLRQQVESGLRASEAHRLLVAGEMHQAAPTGVGDRGSAWATVLAWTEQEAGWIESVLNDLRRGLRATAVAMGPVIDNPMRGPVLSVSARASHGEDDALAPIAVLELASISGLWEALEGGEVAAVGGDVVGGDETVRFAPVRLGGSVAGVIGVVGGSGPEPDTLMERATRVIESRMEADRARSAFSSLLS